MFKEDTSGGTFGNIEYPIRGMKQGEEWISGVSLNDVEELKTPFLFRAFAIYSDFNVFNVLPHGQGTTGERGTVLEVIRILKEEENAWEAWQRDKDKRG